jgi:hypothetical protein
VNIARTILLAALALPLAAELPPVPGAWETRDLAIVCGTTTNTRRKVSPALKDAIYERDGKTKDAPGTKVKVCCEIDHIIPIELGGANSKSNLWAQQWVDARKKDVLENRLHELVCERTLDLGKAQREIATDWEDAYYRYVLCAAK